MSEFNRLIVAVFVIAVMLLAVRRIQKRDLSLSSGVIWIGGGAIALVPLLFAPVLDFITQVIGAKYPASALTLYALIFIALVGIVLSVRLEKAMMELTRIHRNVALLERRIRHLENDVDEEKSDALPS